VRTLLRISVIVYLTYLAIALLVVSPLLNFLPHWYMQDTYSRELRTGWVLFNPFKVSLDISEAALNDDTGEPFLAFSEASVNLSLESLWRPGWVLDTVRIRDLYLDITRLTADEYNFSDLLTDNPEETPSGDTPGLTIRDLDLHSETIVHKDFSREPPYSGRWNGLHIRVSDISTIAEEGRPYIVDLEGEGGGTLHWEGEISLPKETSKGQLAVANLNLRDAWLFAQPWLQFELKEGRLALQGQYQLDWSDNAFSYGISSGNISVTAIDIVPKEPDQLPETAVGFKALTVGDFALDSTTQKVTIDSITLDSLALASWMEGSTISLEKLFIPASPEDDKPTEEEADDSAWSATLNKVQLLNSSLHWRSQITEPAILDIQPIEATVENISWPLSGETDLSLTLSINEETTIAVDSTLALKEGAGNINYTLEGLPLAWFDPNLPEALKADITGGRLEVKGQVTLQKYAPSTLALAGSIRNFSARREGMEASLTGWESVRIEGLAIDMEQHSLVLEKLAIDNYTGRLHIAKDGSINALNVWEEEDIKQAEQIAQQLTQDKPWSFSLPAITITDSEIDFMDQSLPIQFRTVIGDIEGEVLNISSDTDSAATVELTGSVDSYAPVALMGNLSPLADPLALDLNLTFNSVDMALLSPYSGTYAGYAIDRGLLDLDLEYALKENQLKGQNSIRIDKLQLGKKTDSEKAVDLPLELALSILTDSNGVIDIKVPVSGDVTDPEFKLGSVISGAFVNMITKVITAPFSLLAGLVDSEEDLQRLTFIPGYADLSEENSKKLDTLVTAMDQRPNLSLVVTGRINLSADRERLQKNTLKAQFLEEGLSVEDIAEKGPRWEAAIASRYKDLPISGADTPANTVREKYVVVFQSIAVADAQLSTLAEDRAVTAKSYLVNEAGLAPDRAVVGQASLDEKSNTFSGVELGIEH
jgi:hypothetical protein